MSSKGRMPVFETGHGGSNPPASAKREKEMNTKEFVEKIVADEQHSLEVGKANLENVVSFLKTKPYIDEEDIRYFPDNYPFSNKIFQDVFKYLEKRAGNDIHDVTDYFPESRAYFNLNGFKFIWNLMIGQGAALTLYRHDHNPDIIPYMENREIKL